MIMRNRFHCLQCGRELRNSTKMVLTSYPIDWALSCPYCGTEHYLLLDRVLCTAQDFKQRIRQYYEAVDAQRQ